ncbi:MAG: polysaccharide deacetylase family protein, partial [Deltaproteobacteria bacterium]
MGRGRWVKLLGKELFARALVSAGVSRMSSVAQRRALGGRRVLVISYHRVAADIERELGCAIPGLLISAPTLERQLGVLARRYEIVPLGRALKELQSRTPGSDLAVVTFDDGYADVAEVGASVLERLGISATVFLPTGFVGTGRRLPHDRLFAGLSAWHREGRDPDELPVEVRPVVTGLLKRGLELPAMVDVLLATLPERRLLALVQALERLAGSREEELPRGTSLLGWEQVCELAAAGHDIGA